MAVFSPTLVMDVIHFQTQTGELILKGTLIQEIGRAHV